MDSSEYQLTSEQIEEIRTSFNAIDKNHDGRISVGELMSAQQALNLNPSVKDTKEMIKEADLDESGFIELDEYIALMTERYGALQYEEEAMLKAFQHFDKDQNGYLSRSELHKYLTRCGEKLTDTEFNRVMDDIDLNGDGKVDPEEFCTMLLKRH